MNVDRKSILILLLIAIALLLLAGLVLARESPHFNNTKIPSLFIAKNWPTNPIDRLTVSEHEFTCQPDDSQGMRWACVTMLDGKRLEMTASYMPIQSLEKCAIVYGGTPYACEITPGHFWEAMAIVTTDMGISAERMAELRAQRPLTYMSEATWLGVGAAWASALALLTTFVLLTVSDRPHTAVLPVVGVRIPIWALCLLVIGLGTLVNQVTGVILVLPLGFVGMVLLLILMMWLKTRDRKRGPSLALPLVWASVSLVVLWISNFVALFGLMWLGYLD